MHKLLTTLITLLITMIGASLLGCFESFGAASKLVEIKMDRDQKIDYATVWKIEWKSDSAETRGPYYIVNNDRDSDKTLFIGTYQKGDTITFKHEVEYIDSDNCNRRTFPQLKEKPQLHILIDNKEVETSTNTPFTFTVP